MEGRIRKGIGGFYYVHAEDGREYCCRARGIFRKDGTKPLVGDRVKISVIDEAAGEGSVVDVLPRSNSLIRPEAANVDQAMLVFAFASPLPSTVVIDKFLIMLRRQEIPCILLFNKKDLAQEGDAERYLEAYASSGALVMAISAKEDEARDELRSVLEGKTTWLAGPSGVGKSTILNLFCPGAEVQTGDISKKLKRGKNTTRHSEMFPLEGGGFLCDTPGFTSFEFFGLEPEEIRWEYPEFLEEAQNCRFRNCMHLQEPDCRVRKAAQEGRIPLIRYKDYCSIYQEFMEKKRL